MNRERDATEVSRNVPCGLCGTPTPMTGTKRCDHCWELEGRIHRSPDLAAQILSAMPSRSDIGADYDLLIEELGDSPVFIDALRRIRDAALSARSEIGLNERAQSVPMPPAEERGPCGSELRGRQAQEGVSTQAPHSQPGARVEAPCIVSASSLTGGSGVVGQFEDEVGSHVEVRDSTAGFSVSVDGRVVQDRLTPAGLGAYLCHVLQNSCYKVKKAYSAPSAVSSTAPSNLPLAEWLKHDNVPYMTNVQWRELIALANRSAIGDKE